MEASIREPNIKNFVRLLQCAAKYGDDLCMHATAESWELSVTNSTKSAYVCFTLDPAFFSRYRAQGTPVQQRKGVKCQLYVKSVLGVLGKASSVNAVERVDLKIVDPEGGLRAHTQHSDDEEDDDIRVALRTAYLELKLVYHHGITKKHFLHLQSSEFLRVVVDQDSTPSGFLVAAKVLRDWLDHFTIAFGSGSGPGGIVRGDSHLAWRFTPAEVRIKNYESASTSVLSTEITISAHEFNQYEVHNDETVDLSLPMREFKGTLQLAEQFNMDLDFWFSEATQPMVVTSRYLGLDRYGNETQLYKIFAAIATTTCEAFETVPKSGSAPPRDRAPAGNFSRQRSGSSAIKSESRSASIASSRQPSVAASRGASRAASGRPRASLSMAVEPERPAPTFSLGGSQVHAASQAGGDATEPLFQPGPSQGSIRLTQQEVLDLAGVSDLDLQALMDDDGLDLEEEAPAAPAAPDVPNGWDDVDADFAELSPQKMSTQREAIAAAQRPSSMATLSQHGGHSLETIPLDSRQPTQRASESARTVSLRETTAPEPASKPEQSRSPTRQPSRGPERGTSRGPSRSRGPSEPRSRRTSVEFKPDPALFGDEEEVDELEAEELGPTQHSGRKFESLFED